ncbi:MAG: 16S rRNA (cytosine(967)-C(5))-methyltransferase RsmB, partial [Mogibacterium sp.]|nr:16S rRNA (cytosine(967)-C(5))-methyltransferase RsmB [Mogibacterium sp.]
ITSCDIHEHRLKLIDKTMERLGIGIVQSMHADGTLHDKSMDDSFDYVLADVPCSGLGVMAGKPEIRFSLDADGMAGLQAVQKAILKNAARYAKAGGRIEYSTCTLNRDENEGIVESVLNESEGSLLSIIEMKTLMPYNSKVGFFYCILEKSSSLND